MIIVGLTGGIGSGKTTATTFFKDKGVPVYIADDAAKQQLASNADVIKKVITLLGDAAYKNVKGLIVPDKTFIAGKVFKDKQLLEQLNAIIHPAVRSDFLDWVSKQRASYIIYEAAILLESGSSDLCDYIILVYTSLENRISRVINRDNVSRAQVLERISNQWQDIRRLEHAHFVIINEYHNELSIQVNKIHDILLK